MSRRRAIPEPYKLTKKVARQQLAALLVGTSTKALHGYLTVESLCRTTGLPEAEVRVKLQEAREARPL
ncbi:hypothetical protein UFOVP5_43 [uncultured Caudovirales phage]|uniref:Uncharacterized protein n=1 Tax=uncultured Caudovirales phage TaxID=2100421 RepID=A0A6J5KHY0_9CAUD|nr:hypothetical protein UFOVP5_43 [uncultured Caudovirales phage]